MKGKGREIVVDADVGRGAANPSALERGGRPNQRAQAFLRCLNAFYDARHVAVFPPSLSEEWRKHAKGHSSGRQWLTRMLERRLIKRLEEEPDSDWLEAMAEETLQPGDAKAAKKDRHLVAAALRHGHGRLLSGDDKARGKYRKMSPVDAELGRLHWVNPGWDGVPRWLLDRAPDQHAWTLSGESSEGRPHD